MLAVFWTRSAEKKRVGVETTSNDQTSEPKWTQELLTLCILWTQTRIPTHSKSNPKLTSSKKSKHWSKIVTQPQPQQFDQSSGVLEHDIYNLQLQKNPWVQRAGSNQSATCNIKKLSRKLQTTSGWSHMCEVMRDGTRYDMKSRDSCCHVCVCNRWPGGSGTCYKCKNVWWIGIRQYENKCSFCTWASKKSPRMSNANTSCYWCHHSITRPGIGARGLMVLGVSVQEGQ